MSTKPETAYDVRRYLTLVQVIAKGQSEDLRHLAAYWGVDVSMLSEYRTIAACLAHAVIRHYHNEPEEHDNSEDSECTCFYDAGGHLNHDPECPIHYNRRADSTIYGAPR
jgi:hypothetical protein